MISLKLATLAFLLAFWMSFSGAQADANVGGNDLNNNNNLKCEAECTRDLKFKRGVNSDAVCARAKELKLGLTPYHACLRGMDNAFTQICTADCATTSDAKALLVKSSAEACKKWESGMRERSMWCKRGYNETWKKFSSVISRINEETSVEVEESLKDLTDTYQHRAQVLVQEVDHAMEEQLKSKVEEQVGGVIDESVEELVDISDISKAQQEGDHAMEEPFKYEVKESVEVGVGESVELEEPVDARNISQAQLPVEEVDYAVEELLESKLEESGDKPVKYLAYSAKRLVHELEQAKEEQLQIKIEFETLGRNTYYGSASTIQVQELALGLIYSHVYGTSQNKEISSWTKQSPELHGIEHFSSNKTSTGSGHCAEYYTLWSRRCRCIFSLGRRKNHGTTFQLQTHADMGEEDITSAYLSCIRTEVADHMWHPRHRLFAIFDDGGGGRAIIWDAQSGDDFQFIDAGPGHASSPKSFTWDVHWSWVTGFSLGYLRLLKLSSDTTLQQMKELGDLWQRLHLLVWQQAEQKRMDITEHFQQRVKRKLAFTSHDFVREAEVILYFVPQLGSELRGKGSPISMKIVASLDVLKQLCDFRIKTLSVHFSSVLWIQDNAIDFQLILNHRHSIQMIGTALKPCGCGLHSNLILLLRTHMFKETGAHATEAQVLHIATILSTSKSVPRDETAIGQCQSDYRDSYGLGEFVDPLAFEISDIAAQPSQLQPLLGRPSHAAMSRRTNLDSLSLRAPNITARRMDLDEGDSESCHSGGVDRSYAPSASYEMFRLHLKESMLSDQVVSDAESTIIASMYQAGWDDYHRKRDAPNICFVLALFLLVLRCYYCPGMGSTLDESPIDVRVDILETLKESFIEWGFQQRQQANKYIASQLNLIDINWNIASRILANRAQRWTSKFELGRRLHSGPGSCWTQFDHRERQRRNRQSLLRVGKALEESSKKRRMMQRKSRSRLRSRVSVAGCLFPDGVVGLSFFIYSVKTFSLFIFSLGQWACGRFCSSSFIFTNAFIVASLLSFFIF